MKQIRIASTLWSPRFRVIKRSPYRRTVDVYVGLDPVAYGVTGPTSPWHVIGLNPHGYYIS